MPYPHETPFTYDNSLVTSCATSPLARSLIVNRQEGVHDGIFSPSRDENLLHHNQGNTSDCLTLLTQHASHFNRPALSSKERQFWGVWTNMSKGVFDIGNSINKDISTRHEAFLHNVLFIHQHNNDERMNHKVALNQFSDVPLGDFPQVPQHQQLDEKQNDSTQHPQLTVDLDDPMFLHLNDERVIMEIGSKIQRRQRQTSASVSFVENILQTIKESWWWIGGGQLSSENSSSPHSKPSKKAKPKKNKRDSFLLNKQNELGGLENKQNDSDSVGDTDDPYKTYLNWATEDNPDGVSIVHPPVDQGVCGSCWAISALGTMESSIARNMAYIGYETAYNEAVTTAASTTKRHLGEVEVESDVTKKEDHAVFDDSRTLAVLAAQQVEHKSIDLANLSVQELLDCDTRYDQGCAGGNPLLAFYFLHKYGVTSTKNYPYVGTQNACNLHKVRQPIATVETWGVLTADHENNLEKVIRYIGPVAVGLGAYDPAFLSYSEGVFMSTEGSRCNHLVADHAMLIVGYGEEEAKDGSKLKYWICRNSWGPAWGEQGYVKMARVGGKKGDRGICGISRSPSVALGGMFTKNAVLDLDENDLKSAYFGKWNGEEDNESAVARASEQIRSIIHQIRIRLGLMQKGIMMSTLSGNDKNESNRVVLFSMGMGLIMLGILISYTLHRRSRRSARRQRRSLQRTRTEDSASTTNTHPSTMGVYHGERTSLLQHNSVPLYAT
eukprot:scaffold1527_cov145-Skeletonema_menzelii.AAC.7